MPARLSSRPRVRAAIPFSRQKGKQHQCGNEKNPGTGCDRTHPVADHFVGGVLHRPKRIHEYQQAEVDD
jgi:hypothetical protein